MVQNIQAKKKRPGGRFKVAHRGGRRYGVAREPHHVSSPRSWLKGRGAVRGLLRSGADRNQPLPRRVRLGYCAGSTVVSLVAGVAASAAAFASASALAFASAAACFSAAFFAFSASRSFAFASFSAFFFSAFAVLSASRVFSFSAFSAACFAFSRRYTVTRSL